MRFKVDENLHVDVAAALRKEGHDARTVFDQGLRGQSDQHIAQVCRQEERAIVTLDLDFANIRQYPVLSTNVCHAQTHFRPGRESPQRRVADLAALSRQGGPAPLNRKMTDSLG